MSISVEMKALVNIFQQFFENVYSFLQYFAQFKFKFAKNFYRFAKK